MCYKNTFKYYKAVAIKYNKFIILFHNVIYVLKQIQIVLFKTILTGTFFN